MNNDIAKSRTLLAALKEFDGRDSSQLFQETARALGLHNITNPHEFTVKMRTTEIILAGDAEAAWLCKHHTTQALNFINNFERDCVANAAKGDRGIKRVWRDLPNDCRNRMSPVFSMATTFPELATYKACYLTWEKGYEQEFQAIEFVTNDLPQAQRSKQFREIFKRKFPQMTLGYRQILLDILYRCSPLDALALDAYIAT